MNAISKDTCSPPPKTKCDAALAWAARGWPVFRLAVNAKVPLEGSRGHLEATTDPEQIKALWTDPVTGAPAEWNIGCSPRDGRHIIIDLDEKEGRQGIADYLGFGGEIGGLVVRTASGALHVYCRGHNLRTGAGKLAPGIDTRGADGYVVAPGSTINGRAYEIIEDGEPLPVPQFVVDRIGTRSERNAVKLARLIEDDQPQNVARFREFAAGYEAAVPGTWHASDVILAAEALRCAVSPEKAMEVLTEPGGWVARGVGFFDGGRNERWAGDFENCYEWAAANSGNEHGMHALPGVAEAFAGVVAPEEPAPPTARALSPQSRLRLTPQPDCKSAPRRRYVVKDLLAHGDVALVLGAPGAGKTALVPLVCQMVAQGKPAFGKKTRAGLCLYVAAEDPHGLKGRVQALGDHHGDSPNVVVVEGAADLMDAERQNELLRLVHEKRPAIVVLDTVAVAFTGLRENESADMGQVIAFARRLATDAEGGAGPAVILVHHVPKGGETARGHGSLEGAADVVILLQKDAASGIVEGKLTKNRNGPSHGVALAFTITSAIIGRDEDEDAITAAMAVEADAASAGATAAAKAPKLSGQEERALQYLRALIAVGDVDTVWRFNPGKCGFGEKTGDVPAAKLEAWKLECELRHLADSTDPKAQTKAFNRAMGGLTQKGLIGAFMGHVWLRDQPAGGGLAEVVAAFMGVKPQPDTMLQ